MSELILRRMVRETYHPISGRQVTVFQLLAAGHSIPSEGSWDVTDELPGRGRVEGEVVGIAEVESGRRLRNADTIDDLIERVEEIGRVVQLEDDWERDEPDKECSECEDSHDDGACWDDEDESVEVSYSDDDDESDPAPAEKLPPFESLVERTETEPTVEFDQKIESDDRDGFVKFGSHHGDTAHILGSNVQEDDLQVGDVIVGQVENWTEYGVFVKMTNPAHRDPLTGLAHNSQLPLARRPRDYAHGENVFVRVEKFMEQGPSLSILEGEVNTDEF